MSFLCFLRSIWLIEFQFRHDMITSKKNLTATNIRENTIPNIFGSNCLLVVKKSQVTWGILNNLSKLATWIEVTLDAAPTTPEMTSFLFCDSGVDPSQHLTASSSMLAMEPRKQKGRKSFQEHPLWHPNPKLPCKTF